jgi:hypothetical protein
LHPEEIIMKFLIFSVLVLSAAAAFGETLAERDQMHQRVHDMRVLMEDSNAQAENKARSAVIGLFTGGAAGSAGGGGDVQSISQMRNEMNQSFERIENMFPCLGASVNVEEGQAILICGDNQGYAGNDNFEYSDNDRTTFVEHNEANIYLPAETANEVTP